MDSFSKDHLYDDCKPHSKLSKEIFPITFKCSIPNTITVLDSTSAGTAIILASVILNPSSCCKSIIKFEFSFQIVTTAFIGNLNFRIFKLCPHQLIPTPIGTQFTFTRNRGDTSSNALSFFVCDCDCDKHIDECCTFIAIVTTGNVTAGTAAINSATLSALSVPNFKDDFIACSETHQVQCPVLLKCGTPGSLTIPDATPLGQTFPLASVTINTSFLCKPLVALDFASSIDLTNFIGILNFQVFKLCDHEVNPIPIGSQFAYRRGAFGGGALVDDIFAFSICDCAMCSNECCTYTVVVTTATITAGTAIINSATLSAFAIDTESQCN
jgi:hypothetical protein